MRPKVTPLSPLPIHLITFLAAQRSNQGLVHQVAIGHAAVVGGLVGAAVLRLSRTLSRQSI